MNLTVYVNGKKLEAREDDNLLNLLLEKGFEVPALCYHKGLPSYGACRLCTVEIGRGERKRLVASCTYPVRENNIEVTTNSNRTRNLRRMIIQFLLARAPEIKKIQELAKDYNVKEEPRYEKTAEEKCILCGRCVRVCNNVLEKHAINFANRGIDRKVSPPFEEPPEDCIGCTACAEVCPTGAVFSKIIDEKKYIYPWEKEHYLINCKNCGQKLMGQDTLTEDTVNEVINKLKEAGLITAEKEEYPLCLECKRKEAIRKLEI